ncbi:MAG: hypothetical protein V4674_01000 [Patescibacteria group bacterium]
MPTFQDLYAFVDTAVRNRKYPESTAQGLRAALKLFEKELNDEERDSLDKFTANIEPIYQNVCRHNSASMSASSLAAYRSRVTKTVSDFNRYGVDPTKMASWNYKSVKRVSKSASGKSTVEPEGTIAPNSPIISTGADMHRIELSLRPGTKFTIYVPRDINEFEATALKGILDSLVKSNL